MQVAEKASIFGPPRLFWVRQVKRGGWVEEFRSKLCLVDLAGSERAHDTGGDSLTDWAGRDLGGVCVEDPRSRLKIKID